MNVSFYTFNKKSNSTAIPSGTGTEAPSDVTCYLKDACSILSPVIQLEQGTSTRPTWNYAYIADFSRYYFVSDWTWSGRFWICALNVDVLASYKSAIGSHSMYVLRASAQSNGRVIDTKYPTLSQANSYYESIGSTVSGVWTAGTVMEYYGGSDHALSNYFNNGSLNSGYFYIGVTGNNVSGVTWYLCAPAGFNSLVNLLYTTVPSDMGSLDTGVAKQLANPMQYIVSCYWLPTAIGGAVISDTGTDIKFGDYTFRLPYSTQFDPITNIHKYHAEFKIHKHPQAATRGLYLNQSPYSYYRIVFPPFGTFDLDSTLMVDDTKVTAEWYIDYTTGMADLTIRSINSYMAHVTAPFGVPIRLNQMNIDLVGAGAAVVKSGANYLAGLAENAFEKIAAATVGGFAGAVQAKGTSVSTMGGAGLFVPFKSYPPRIYADHYYVVDEYNADLGRPLCTVTTPSTLGSGYILAEEGDIVLTGAYDSEIDAVNSFLTGGFFYE